MGSTNQDSSRDPSKKPKLSTRKLGAGFISTAAAIGGIAAGAAPAAASLGHRFVYFAESCGRPGDFGDDLDTGQRVSNYGGARGGCNGNGYVRIGMESRNRNVQYQTHVGYGSVRSGPSLTSRVPITYYTRLRSTDASRHKTSGVDHHSG